MFRRKCRNRCYKTHFYCYILKRRYLCNAPNLNKIDNWFCKIEALNYWSLVWKSNRFFFILTWRMSLWKKPGVSSSSYWLLNRMKHNTTRSALYYNDRRSPMPCFVAYGREEGLSLSTCASRLTSPLREDLGGKIEKFLLHLARKKVIGKLRPHTLATTV